MGKQLGLQLKPQFIQHVSESLREYEKRTKGETLLKKTSVFLSRVVPARLELMDKIDKERNPKKKEGLQEAYKLLESAFDVL